MVETFLSSQSRVFCDCSCCTDRRHSWMEQQTDAISVKTGSQNRSWCVCVCVCVTPRRTPPHSFPARWNTQIMLCVCVCVCAPHLRGHTGARALEHDIVQTDARSRRKRPGIAKVSDIKMRGDRRGGCTEPRSWRCKISSGKKLTDLQRRIDL